MQREYYCFQISKQYYVKKANWEDESNMLQGRLNVPLKKKKGETIVLSNT